MELNCVSYSDLHAKNIMNNWNKLENEKEVEPLLSDVGKELYVLFPIKYPDLYEKFRKGKSLFWVPEEINFENDLSDWNNLNNDEKYYLSKILGFFAGSDSIIMENLMQNFTNEIKVAEAQHFYAYQVFSESIHSETY